MGPEGKQIRREGVRSLCSNKQVVLIVAVVVAVLIVVVVVDVVVVLLLLYPIRVKTQTL